MEYSILAAAIAAVIVAVVVAVGLATRSSYGAACDEMKTEMDCDNEQN